MKNQKKHTLVSLFAGCGGLDLGFTGGFDVLNKKYTKRNFDLIWANDFEKKCLFNFFQNTLIKRLFVQT